jgi:hypothetical protein
MTTTTRRPARAEPVTCPSCTTHFADVTGFDAHRERGRCIDPASARLVWDAARGWRRT